MTSVLSPSRRRSGFTLVELLVVIGIVAVLIALLFPALSKVREHANRVKCAANLRSIGQALQAYTQQYGFYPGYGIRASRGGPDFAIWPVRLRPFLGGNQDVFFCPSRDDRFKWRRTDGLSPEGSTHRWTATADEARYGYEIGEPMLVTALVPIKTTFFSYGYNFRGAGDANDSVADGTHKGLGQQIDGERWAPESKAALRELRANRVKAPSEMIAIADSAGMGLADFVIHPFVSAPLNPGTVHNGGANVLFCDGHVMWYPQKDLVLEPVNFPNTDTWRVWIRRWCNDNKIPRDFGFE